MEINVLFLSVHLKWVRKRHIHFNDFQILSALDIPPCFRKQGNSPSSHYYFGSSWGWTVCLEYDLERKQLPVGMGMAILSGVRCHYSWNPMRKRNMSMTFSVEGLRACPVCKGKPSLSRVVLWTKIQLSVTPEAGPENHSKMSRSPRNKAWLGNFQGGFWVWGLERQVSVMRKKKSCSRNSWCVPLKCLFMALPWTVFSLYNVLALHSKIPSIASVTRILLEFDLLRKLAHYVIISCWILHSCMRKMHGNPSPPKIRF